MQTTSMNRAQQAHAAQAPLAAAAASNPNAILSKYRPTGASAATAKQDRLPGGVASSHKMAQTDLPKIKKFADEFAAAGRKHGVPPALLAAIASRESRGGSALDSRGFGDHGNGFGLMQVDKRFHSLKGGPFSAAHIDQAAGILKSYLNQVKARHPSWPPEQQLRGAVAAYNSGVGNVQTIERMDVGTTGNDYSNDVWARAQALAPHFGGTAGGSGGSTGPTGPGRPSGGANLPNETLKEGSRGENVKTLQKALEKVGFDVGTPDGIFGPRTEAAVKRFQSKHNLQADGIVGPKTREALERELDRAAKPKPAAPQKDGFERADKWKDAPALADVKSGKEHLRQGMEGGSVRHVQKLLGIETDGKFGPATKRAVADFQRDHRMEVSGSVGPKTLAAMEKAAKAGGVDGISARGRRQMEALLDMAQRNSAGKRPDGRCLWHVNNWLDRSTYAKIGNGNSPRLPLARNYGDWLNANHERLGLKKLNIDNPYKAPPGSIVVVRPGTPGTAHPTAGDIVVVGRNGHFYNGGEMGYGGPQNFPRGNRHVIGIFAPE